MKAEPDRTADSKEFLQKAVEAGVPLPAQQYPLTVLEPKVEGVILKRGDPELKAPIKVMGHTLWGSIVTVGPDTWVDPMVSLENAPQIEAKGAKSSKSKRGRNMGMEGTSDMAGMPGMMPGAEGGMDGMGTSVPAGPRRLFPIYDRGFPVNGGMGGMGMGMGMGGAGMDAGMSMGMGAGAGMPGGDGMGMPGADGGMGMGMGMSGEAAEKALAQIGIINAPRGNRPKRMVPTFRMYNVVMALLPHEEMVLEFERKFKYAGSYNPYRDRPIYFDFQAQRVDVTANPLRQIKEEEWQYVMSGTLQSQIMAGKLLKKDVLNPPSEQRPWINYPGLDRLIYGQFRLTEYIDLFSYDPALTMILPPLLVRDYRQLTKHPDIPWSWVAARQRLQEGLIAYQEKEIETDVLPAERPGASPMGGMGGMPGMGMDAGMGMPGMEGMGMPGTSMPGMDGFGADMGMGMGMDGMGGMGVPGMDMGMSMGMGGMSGSYTMTQAIVAKHKMLRFYDPLTPADLGKVYRYRVRAIMVDPNYPDRDIRWANNPATAKLPDRDLPGPLLSDLMPDVLRRVSVLKAKDDPLIKADKKRHRTMRETPWSEPSDLFRVEYPAEVIAGEVVSPKPTPFDGGKVVVATRPPQVKVVANVINTTYNTLVPYATERFLERGTVLNGVRKDVEIVNPINKVIKKLPTANIVTRATIADIRGAESLPNSAGDDPLAEMGEILVVTGTGNVVVTNEWDDQFLYRMYTFADEKEAAKKAQSTMGAGGMPGMDGMGAGMPGT